MPFLRWILCCVLCAIPLAGLAELDPIEAPISLAATPKAGMHGTAITLSGETLVVKSGAAAKVTVTPPTGSPTTLQATVNKNGKYSVSFKATGHVGIYKVSVLAPDGKGSAKGDFRIVGGADAADSVVAVGAHVSKTQMQALQKARGLLQQVPSSAGKAEALDKLSEIQGKLGQLDTQRLKVEKALVALTKAHASAGGGGALDKRLAEVTTEALELTEISAQTREQLNRTVPGAKACDMLDNVVEVLNLVSTLLDLQGGLFAVIGNLATDKVIPAGIDTTSATSSMEGRFAVSEAQKALYSAAQGYNALAKSAGGLLVDAGTYIVKKLYSAYCTRFDGPVDAVFTARMFTENKEYWSYRMHLVGKLVLSEPKSAGDASTMSGYITGNAADYQVKENALLLQPEMAKFLAFRKLIAPGKLPLPLEENGALFNLKSPFSFYIPVKATRVDDLITLKVGEATKDLSETVNRGIVYYVFNTGLIPMLVNESMPMQTAQFIFSRGIHVDEGEPTLQITYPGGTKFERTFTRDESVDNDQVKVHWEVKVKACSPGCTKSTIDKLKDAVKGK